MPAPKATTNPSSERPAAAVRAAQAGGRPLLVLLLWTSAAAVLLSTQFLFQPFVWRNWGLADILAAWLDILKDRLVVATAIAAALAVAARTRLPGPAWASLVLAVVIGASVGELVIALIGSQDDPQDIASLLGRIMRWSLVGSAIAVMLQIWRSGAELAAAARETQIQEAQTRRLAASSQIEMLRRQIEPHFLFNTLATIRRLNETDPQRGRRLLGRLFDYMSATLSGTPGGRTTLGDEISLVLAYLDVCASRMSGRLAVRCEAPDALRVLDFPPLVLATLAENAVKHGVFPANGGTVVIGAERVGDRLEVSVADDGKGLSGEGGSGLGLANIAERLRLLYGTDAELRLQANEPRGVRAVVRIPWPAGVRG